MSITEEDIEKPDVQYGIEDQAISPGVEKTHSKKKKQTTFAAHFYRVVTTPDGGWRVSFEVPDSEASQVMELAQMRNIALQIGVVEHDG